MCCAGKMKGVKAQGGSGGGGQGGSIDLSETDVSGWTIHILSSNIEKRGAEWLSDTQLNQIATGDKLGAASLAKQTDSRFTELKDKDGLLSLPGVVKSAQDNGSWSFVLAVLAAAISSAVPGSSSTSSLRVLDISCNHIENSQQVHLLARFMKSW